eukprot:TRINITY_DN1811_c1_g4_i1.p1 TRINITY_DN1811_c1_g4~~TRINITY_DN1811_c1_g4_i1.p1  ORF type:complete len:126 (-),score=16.64 TRINITY_DN1811_c1_g4_i1:63-440(-)
MGKQLVLGLVMLIFVISVHSVAHFKNPSKELVNGLKDVWVKNKGISCDTCTSLWNGLRDQVGCDGNSKICDSLKWTFNVTDCQNMIDSICSYGCEKDPSVCSQLACSIVGICEPPTSEALKRSQL